MPTINFCPNTECLWQRWFPKSTDSDNREGPIVKCIDFVRNEARIQKKWGAPTTSCTPCSVRSPKLHALGWHMIHSRSSYTSMCHLTTLWSTMVLEAYPGAERLLAQPAHHSKRCVCPQWCWSKQTHKGQGCTVCPTPNDCTIALRSCCIFYSRAYPPACKKHPCQGLCHITGQLQTPHVSFSMRPS